MHLSPWEDIIGADSRMKNGKDWPFRESKSHWKIEKHIIIQPFSYPICCDFGNLAIRSPRTGNPPFFIAFLWFWGMETEKELSAPTPSMNPDDSCRCEYRPAHEQIHLFPSCCIIYRIFYTRLQPTCKWAKNN